VVVDGERKHTTFDLLSEKLLLIIWSVFKYFLDDVIAKFISHDLSPATLEFDKKLILFIISDTIVDLLYEPGAFLVGNNLQDLALTQDVTDDDIFIVIFQPGFKVFAK
jgi:hypothetical protein